MVPEAVVGDAFVPESLREKLGLKTNGERFARDAASRKVGWSCTRRSRRNQTIAVSSRSSVIRGDYPGTRRARPGQPPRVINGDFERLEAARYPFAANEGLAYRWSMLT